MSCVHCQRLQQLHFYEFMNPILRPYIQCMYRWCASYVTVAMLDDIDKEFCLFAMQTSNMAKISLSFESHGSGCNHLYGNQANCNCSISQLVKCFVYLHKINALQPQRTNFSCRLAWVLTVVVSPQPNN
jgi:hypothetical protein